MSLVLIILVAVLVIAYFLGGNPINTAVKLMDFFFDIFKDGASLFQEMRMNG